MLRPRRRAAFWWTFGVTLVVAVALGSPLAGDRLVRRGNPLSAQLIAGLRFPGWQLRPGASTILEWSVPIVANVVLAVLVGVVAILATAARVRIAAFLAGWGLLVVATPLVGVGRVLVLASLTHPGGALDAMLSDVATSGLWFGLAMGWLPGLILACTVRKTPVLDLTAEAVDPVAITTVQPVRIWTPSQPDWQQTSDMPAVGDHPPYGQPSPQPWGPAPNPQV